MGVVPGEQSGTNRTERKERFNKIGTPSALFRSMHVRRFLLRNQKTKLECTEPT